MHPTDKLSAPDAGDLPEPVKTANTDAGERRQRQWDVSGVLWRFSIPILLVIVLAGASALRPQTFPTLSNITAILSLQSLVLILALAGALLIIVGEFDISIANNAALVAALTVGLQVTQHLPWGVAVLVGLVTGVTVGAVNAVLVVGFKVSAFVATLGMYTVLQGMWTLYLNDQVVSPINPLPKAFTNIGRSAVWGLEVPFFIAMTLAIIGFVVLRWLPAGRRMYAVGGNRRAASFAGIRTGRTVVAAFLVAGLLAGIAGVLLGAQYGNASPGAGSELLFPAFAGVFLGATTITPGRYNVLGIVLSIYTLAFLIAGFQQLGGIWSETWVGPTFNGVAVIVAVSLSRWAFSYRERKTRKLALERLRHTQ
jgi:ribose transport system permease protein